MIIALTTAISGLLLGLATVGPQIKGMFAIAAPVRKLFVGNVPDKQFVRSFFGDRYEFGIEDSPGAAIGIWRTQEEFVALAEETGWGMEVRHMPKDFYWGHYRYDVVLLPG